MQAHPIRFGRPGGTGGLAVRQFNVRSNCWITASSTVTNSLSNGITSVFGSAKS